MALIPGLGVNQVVERYDDYCGHLTASSEVKLDAKDLKGARHILQSEDGRLLLQL